MVDRRVPEAARPLPRLARDADGARVPAAPILNARTSPMPVVGRTQDEHAIGLFLQVMPRHELWPKYLTCFCRLNFFCMVYHSPQRI